MEHGTSGNNTVGIKAPFFDGSQICAQTDPELFFPETHSNSRLQIAMARRLCASCEFKEPCLEYAVKNSTVLGIWAGTTESQRDKIRSEKNKLRK